MKNWLIISEQTVLRNTQINKITKQLEKSFQSLEVVKFDLDLHDLSEVIETALTISMFDEHKLIIVSNAYFLTSISKKQTFEHDIDNFIEFIEHIPDFTSIVFSLDTKLDERKKVVKQMKTVFEVISFDSFDNHKIEEIIIKKFEQNNIEISKDNAVFMADYLSYNLEIINNEILKLCLLHKTLISREDIELYCVASLERNIFDFIGAISTNQALAYEYLNDLYRQNEDTIKLIAMISSSYRLIFQSKSYGVFNTQDQIAKKLKVHPYRVKLALENNLSIDTLKSILKSLGLLDFEIKSGKIDSRLALECWLLKKENFNYGNE